MRNGGMSLGLLLVCCMSGCDGTDGVVSSSLPNTSPAASSAPVQAIPTPEPAGFGVGVPIGMNGSVTNSPSTNGTNVTNPPAPALPRDLGSGAVISYSSSIVGIFQGACCSCHSPGGTGYASLALFDSQGMANYSAIRNNISSIVASVTRGSMPPQGFSIPVSQQTLLKSWQLQGAQLN